ncbi:MAG: DEAD/DEAH box helicase [Panacagrimonas sp.]
MEADHLSNTRFDALPLHPSLQSAVQRLGFDRCTPIQAQTLPLALEGRDLAGQAQTGTGKTAAFLLATMHRLLTVPRTGPEGQPRAFMLAPTRELAVQIYDDALQLGADSGLRCTVCFGGTGYESQRQAITDGVDILIGTPGRLIDYYKQDVYSLKHIEVVVLDEADRMFDLGFIADIRYLLRRMPPPMQRRNYLFSATLSHRVLELAFEHMNDPQKITIESEQVTADRVRQSLIHVSNDDKLKVLVALMRHHDPFRTLVFVNTKRGCEDVERTLRANGFDAQTLSGDVPQNKRLRLLDDFKEGKLPILVATDVAARGLHIPAVSHVINYDLPQDAEDYVHRIGRTARAGEAGDAISLCCETFVYSLPDIERFIGTRLPVETLPPEWIGEDFVEVAPLKRPHTSRGGPHRGGGGSGPRRPGGGPPRRGGRR